MMKENFNTSFVHAAEKGNTKSLINQYQHSKFRRKSELYFALYFASLNGYRRIVNFLLAKKVDPNFTVESYLTPLHAAAFKDRKNIVRSLLHCGANVNPKIKLESGEEINYFCSPLMSAVCSKNKDMVELLLKKGAIVDVKFESIADQDKLKKSMNISWNKPAQFEKFLNYGTFDPEDLIKHGTNGFTGFTALHFAVKFNEENIIKILLNHGADVNSRSGLDLTPLCLASTNNNVSVVNLLLKAGADLKMEVNHGKQLLSYILQDMVKNRTGFRFSYNGYEKLKWVQNNKVFSHLLKIGADPNGWSTGKKGTILHYAASKGMANAVHLLLKHGANVNSVNGDGKTPFEYAVNHLQNLLNDIQDNFSDILDSSINDEANDEERLQEREANQFANKKIYNLTHSQYRYKIKKYRNHYKDDGGYTIFRDPNPYRMISQLLTRELVRLEALGTRNVQQNVKLLETTFVKPYYTRCKNELKKLKKTAIADSVNYYDFLFANDSKLDEFMENEKITSSIDKENCRKQFPNYSRFLRLKVKRGLKRKWSDVDKESNGSSDEDFGKDSVQVRKK